MSDAIPPRTVPAALLRAIRQLPEPEMRTPLLQSIGWTILGFVALWLAVGWSLQHWLAGRSAALDWAVRILGVLAAPYISWLLFPSVATAILGLYSDRLVAAVEHRFYPNLPAPPPLRWRDQTRSVLRLFALSLALLPLYLVFLVLPGVNLFLFLALNGYVLGRGYFDLVALRRLEWEQARRLWPACRVDFMLAGIAVAAVFTVPLANLLAPVIGTAAAVHLFQRHRAIMPP
jgi:uncharacterized protein involved in cysteine biosynthesis